MSFLNPKGTIDYYGDDYIKLRVVSEIIEDVFRFFGGNPLETPIFENRSTMDSKYSDEIDKELLWNLEEPLETKEVSNKVEVSQNAKYCLRYDHTVPLVRYLVQKGVVRDKIYQIGRVFRKDCPSQSNKRYREFWQGDFDFVGEYESLISECQIFKMIEMVMERLGLSGQYKIFYNYRENLKSMICETCEIKEEKFTEISRAIDKLDKYSWDYIVENDLKCIVSEEEMLRLKGCLDSNKIFSEDVRVVDQNFRYLYTNLLDDPSSVIYDCKLARGLDYYTGLIYEVRFLDTNYSVAAGGRYDNLYNNFRKKKSVEMIGLSFGINRIIPKVDLKKVVVVDTRSRWKRAFKIMIASFKSGKSEKSQEMEQKFLERKLQLVKLCWGLNIQPFFFVKPKAVKRQFNEADENGINDIIIFGETEINKGCVKFKDSSTRNQTDIDNCDIVEYLKLLKNR